MKRFIFAILAITLLLSLSACGDSADSTSPENTETKNMDVIAEAQAITEKYSLTSGIFYSSAGEPLTEDDIFSLYSPDGIATPDFEQVEAYAVYIDQSNGLKPCEFGIFKMKDGADYEGFLVFMQERINAKIANASRYPDIDMEVLETAKFTIKGNYVWYCVVSGGNSDIDADLQGKV